MQVYSTAPVRLQIEELPLQQQKLTYGIVFPFNTTLHSSSLPRQSSPTSFFFLDHGNRSKSSRDYHLWVPVSYFSINFQSNLLVNISLVIVIWIAKFLYKHYGKCSFFIAVIETIVHLF